VKTYNLQFTSNEDLKIFITTNRIDVEKNVLVQIFLGVIDESLALNISKNIKTLIPTSHILGTTTTGEIVDGKMCEKSIIISFTFFEKTILKSNIYDSSDVNIEDMMSELITTNTKALIIFSDGLKSNGESLISKISEIKKDLIIAGGRAVDN